MITIKEKVNKDLSDAMKSKNQASLRALRALKSAFTNTETAKGFSGTLTDDVALKIIQKQISQRKESISQFEENGRHDLSIFEKEEIDVLSAYLPKQLSNSEIENIVSEQITTMGVSSIREMGKIMGFFNKNYSGQFEGQVVSEIIKNKIA